MHCNVTIKQKQDFFKILKDVLDNAKEKEDILLIGDFYSHLENEEWDIVWRLGEEEIRNDNERPLIEICRIKIYITPHGSNIIKTKNQLLIY